MIRRVLAPFRTVFSLTVVAVLTIILGSFIIVLVKIRPNTRWVTPIMRLPQ